MLMSTRFATLLLGSIAVASCSDASLGTDRNLGERTGRLGAVEAVVRQEEQNADGTITFALRVRARDVSVSAFQGRVAFARGAFELVSVNSAQGGAAEMYLVNPSGFAAGTIRFAAFTTNSFSAANSEDGVEVMRVVVRPLRSLVPSDVGPVLEAVAGPDGAAPKASGGLATGAAGRSS
ncbi:MAG TPA: hypothetical protein VJR92_05520 [Gemmatimonadaceae bacterium]|nr:hypothetical protein [Gemmatimonadaceae bacterium]